MRGGEKGHFPKPYLASKKVSTVPEDEGYSWDDGFCDFAFSSAQNNSIGGGIQISYLNEGMVQSFSYGADPPH